MSAIAPCSPLGPNEPDWPLIQADYLRGFSPKELAEKYHVAVRTIHKRVVRGKWAQLRTETRQPVASAELGGAALQEHSSIVRKRLSDELIRASSKLGSLPEPKSVQSRSERGRMLKDLVEPAKILYGWENHTTINLFNLPLLDSVKTIEQKPTQPIDIETVTTKPDTGPDSQV